METNLFEQAEYPFFDKIKKSMVVFLHYALFLFITYLFIKFLEYSYFLVKGQIPVGFLTVVAKAFFFDVVFFLKCLPFLYLVFLLFYFSMKRRNKLYVAAGVIFSLFILIYLLLIKYYFTAMVPLGADLFGYSFADIKKTVSSSTSIDLMSIVVLLLPFALLWLSLYKYRNKSFFKFPVALGVLLFGLVLLYFKAPSLPSQAGFKSDFAYNLAVNKDAFFFENTYLYFFDNEPEVDIYAANYFDESAADSKIPSANFKYVDAAYPFLRQEDTEDVLSNHFNLDSIKQPNFIFIQVEGLGRAFSGPNAYLGSFTPFLDELRTKSLYFENFLAAQGRTFASLPSILGSLPFFEKGYNDLGNKMPDAFTVLSLLKHNNYQTSFFIATDLEFDNEGLFVRKQGVHKVLDKNSFGDYPSNHNTYWGYPDLDLMQKSLTQLRSQGNAPFVSYIQTISMHTPYKVPEMDKYYQAFEQHMNKLGFDETQKSEHRSNKDQYACILYTDDALRYFLNEFSKLPAFANTIFIITGDHRLPEIPMSTKIDRYHVPLLIYSPMLKKNQNIKSVSSHLDIAPSILAMMRHRYQLDLPNLVTWVGSGLDTVKQFRNIHRYPLKQTVSDMIDYVSGEYFLNDKTLFSLNDNFNIQPMDDDSRRGQLVSEFNQYKSQNNQLIKSLRLLPDTLFKKFKP